jgi:hypothetical protein
VNKNFYNAVAYKYNEDSVEEKFLNKFVVVSADSSNRIGAPSRPFVIEADGLKPSPATTQLIERNSNRFLGRYKYGAEFIKVKTLFKTGFGVEPGDSILFGESGLYLSDTTKGSKDFSARVMEVVNVEWNWKSGDIALSLLDTTYSTDTRYGVYSPSSILGSGSTTDYLILTDSFGTTSPAIEKDKWETYVGKEIFVHSVDWSVQGVSTIAGFESGNDYKMLLSSSLGFTPAAGYMLDIVSYDEVDPLEGFYKNAHCFYTPQVTVVSGASATSFDVAPGDIGKFFVGSLIRVHNASFSVDSGLTSSKVTAISGNTITCNDLGFTPVAGYYVDLIGFASDEGKPYPYL